MIAKIKKSIPYILIGVCVVVMLYMFSQINSGSKKFDTSETVDANEPKFLFGICIDSLEVATQKIKRGDTFGAILARYEVTPATTYEITQKAEGVFDLRSFRMGNTYNVMLDSTKAIQYFIYEHSIKEYVVIDFTDDIKIIKNEKDVEVKRRYGEAVISSSMWNAAIEAGMNPTLAMNLSDVYQWAIDFYGIQKGDKFEVLYDEFFIEGKSIGVGTIWGATFTHNDKEFHAVRYEYKDKGIVESGYWDEVGKSLKSAFLKAPLKYSRISSKFSYSRMHPVYRVRKAHTGVDYAAPSGTPVQAISNGIIISKGYGVLGRGGGHAIKIRHARGYQSGYLHLRGYAKGIVAGATVKQGQTIGYVGSTGASTGPHLDFRIWKNGKPLDPLKMVGEKGEDIKKSQKESYNIVKESVFKELQSKGAIVENKFNGVTDSTSLKMITVPIK